MKIKDKYEPILMAVLTGLFSLIPILGGPITTLQAISMTVIISIAVFSIFFSLRQIRDANKERAQALKNSKILEILATYNPPREYMYDETIHVILKNILKERYFIRFKTRGLDDVYAIGIYRKGTEDEQDSSNFELLLLHSTNTILLYFESADTKNDFANEKHLNPNKQKNYEDFKQIIYHYIRFILAEAIQQPLVTSATYHLDGSISVDYSLNNKNEALQINLQTDFVDGLKKTEHLKIGKMLSLEIGRQIKFDFEKHWRLSK